MSDERFSRSELLFGEGNQQNLAASRVAVFGLGGVGGAVTEALARAGIGNLDLIDNDVVSVSNINRQILATDATVGRPKTAVAAERVASINPACRVRLHNCFVLPDTIGEFDFAAFDYVVDAIDTVSGKLAIAEACQRAGTPLICVLGAGNKLDPMAFRVADIAETREDPLARVLRTECRKRGIGPLQVVYSEEPPLKPLRDVPKGESGHALVPGSVSFVPPAAGLLAASVVVRALLGETET